MGWKNDTTAEAPQVGGALARALVVIVAGLVAMVAAGLIWNQVRLARDTDKLKALKSEPIASFAPPGFRRETSDERDDHTVWYGDNSEIDDPRVYLHVIYRRPGASPEQLDAAVQAVTDEARRQGFTGELAGYGYTLSKPVGKEWHAFTSLDGRTKGYNKIVADLKVEPDGTDGVQVSLDYNGSVTETSLR